MPGNQRDMLDLIIVLSRSRVLVQELLGHRMLLCPFPRCRNSGLLILLPRLSNIWSQRIIRVRGAQQCLDG